MAAWNFKVHIMRNISISLKEKWRQNSGDATHHSLQDMDPLHFINLYISSNLNWKWTSALCLIWKWNLKNTKLTKTTEFRKAAGFTNPVLKNNCLYRMTVQRPKLKCNYLQCHQKIWNRNKLSIDMQKENNKFT